MATPQNQISTAFKIKTSHYIIAGLSLVVALSWNDAIKAIIKNVYILPNDVIWGSILYALTITAVLVLIIYLLPDTKSELPIDTQAKINHAETLQSLRQMQDQVSSIKFQNEVLMSKG